jgi:hypothetical protein
MASTIDLSGLKRYMARIHRYETLLKYFSGAMEEICKEAKAFAESKYTSHGHSSINVEYTNNGKTATIYAKGTAVAFFEFGTGEYASGSYKGSIPQSGVPITEKWEYYYEEPASGHKVTLNGVKGWFWKGNFVTGNKAEAEMWETSQFIAQRARIILQKYFKNESGAV